MGMTIGIDLGTTNHEIHFEVELIDTVLLVGGSSSIPAIQDALKTLFGEHKVQIHPRLMLAIAEGAALMAAKLANQETRTETASFSMMHSTAHDYYLQLARLHERSLCKQHRVRQAI